MNIIKYVSLLSVSLLATLLFTPAYTMERHATGMDIFQAVFYDDLVCVQNFIAEDPTVVHQLNNRKETPLHTAASDFEAKKNTSAIVNALIAAGADVNKKDYEGNTPLHWATWARNIAVITTLIAAGADLNIRERHGRTPFESICGLCQFHQELVSLYPDAKWLHASDLKEKKEIIDLLADYEQRIHNAQQTARRNAEILALATHPRIGAESPLAILPYEGAVPSLLRDITELMAKAEDHDARQPRVTSWAWGCVIS